MSKALEEKVLNAYREGCEISLISEHLQIPDKRVIKILANYKKKSVYKRTYTDELKKIIAERDLSGISRRQISLELGINSNTIKKFCVQFGQAFKDKATSENEYTRIDGVFEMSTCHSCQSENVNEVDDNTIYCMDCGSEYIYKVFNSCPSCNNKDIDRLADDKIFCSECDSEHFIEKDHILKVNWEYIE